jgi:hypothetical protein
MPASDAPSKKITRADIVAAVVIILLIGLYGYMRKKETAAEAADIAASNASAIATANAFGAQADAQFNASTAGQNSLLYAQLSQAHRRT